MVTLAINWEAEEDDFEEYCKENHWDPADPEARLFWEQKVEYAFGLYIDGIAEDLKYEREYAS